MIGEQREALAEQWVLEFVIKNSFPIDWFGVDTEAEFIGLTNRYLGTLGVVDVREALVRLAAAGAITFTREGSSPNYLRRPLDNLELRAAMRGSSPYQYSLTVLGGQLWEDRAHPRWEHFVATGYGHAAPEFGRNSAQISAQARELAEQYLERQHVRWRCSVVPGSVRGEAIAPWHATYWKTLSEGYRITFAYDPHGSSLEVPGLVPAETREWFKLVDQWFTPVISRD